MNQDKVPNDLLAILLLLGIAIILCVVLIYSQGIQLEESKKDIAGLREIAERYWNDFVDCDQTVIDCPACELTCNCPEYRECENPKFQEIVENLASEEDYRDEYNCDEFSNELVGRLEDAGYNASYCHGTYLQCDPSESDFNCRHAWVKIEDIYVEATLGEILSPERFEEDYDLKWCK